MKARDILILAVLVVLILVLTIAEQYGERRQELRREQERLAQLEVWREKIGAAFESRWVDLSIDLRAALDSMAQEIIAGGVGEDSLAVVVVGSSDEAPKAAKQPPASVTQKQADSVSETLLADSLARNVAREYEAALAALPKDLSAYEKRVATNEVASLVRARFGLTPARFDSLLLRASKQLEHENTASGD